MTFLLRVSLLLTMAAIAVPVHGQPSQLPAPAFAEFCQVVQQIMANTAVVSNNTVFDNMPD